MFEEKYGKDVRDFKSYKAEQEAKTVRDSAFGDLKELYEDFDGNMAEEALKELRESGDMKKLYEMLHFARLGRMTPLELEKRITENLAKKKNAGLPSTAGAAVKVAPKEVGTINEVRSNLIEQLE